MIRVGLIGDRSAEVRAHAAIPPALQLAGSEEDVQVEHEWLPTDGSMPSGGFDALWCVPGSPYASMDGALAWIRFARENGTVFLGTCGGFQHAVIEYFRNVLGQGEADHAESNPGAEMPLMSALACALVGVTGEIVFQTGSRIAGIYGSNGATEEFQCSYGFNRLYQDSLAQGALSITGFDSEGSARVVELAGHPFYLATLFQPELSALRGRSAHPIVRAFVRAAIERAAKIRE